jgi:hypothetical protein
MIGALYGGTSHKALRCDIWNATRGGISQHSRNARPAAAPHSAPHAIPEFVTPASRLSCILHQNPTIACT